MPVRNRSEIASFDADAAFDAVQDTVSGTLYTFCEYDTEEFRPLYVDDRTLELYADHEEMAEHFERIHTNVHMDFTQMQVLKRTLFPDADRVEYIVTAMDFMKVLRIYVGNEGLFVAIDPEEPVVPVVDAVKDATDWPSNQNP